MTRRPGAGRARRAAARPCLDPRRVAVAFVGAEAVLLDLRTYRATRANPVAAHAVALLDGTRSVGAIARALATAFGVSGDRALGDLGRLLAALEDRGFLRSRRRPVAG
jgi:hypothetical protein